MPKIYFFQRRNIQDGTLREEYFDVEDEKQARDYFNSGRHYKYVGWSDGRFIIELKRTLSGLKLKKDKNDIPKDVSEATKSKIREAQKRELEFAKNNTDKTPPRDNRTYQAARQSAEAEFHRRTGK